MNKILHIVILLIFSTINLFSQKYPIITNPNSVVLTPLTQLNSQMRETNISITPDGKYMYFMSDRGGQSWSTYSGTFRGKLRYDGDIWFSEYKNGRWGKPTCLNKSINTSSGEDEPNITPDGQRVVYQSWGLDYYHDGGPYYVATLNGTKWGRPVGLGGGISEFFVDEMNKYYGYGTDGMSLSPDGKTFIVACGEDYDGNLDLYFSSKRKGDWSYLKKMSISTSGDERSIFIAADGKTIYFASDAYGGFGGLDIFKATIDDKGNASDITNIGRPFNSPNDDYGLVITADGKKAYFVRDGDIYFADLQDNSPVAPGPSILISGTVTDCDFVPLEIGLQLVNSSNEQVSVCKSSRGGNFVFSIPDQTGQFKILNSNNDVIETLDITSNNDFQEIEISITDCSDFNKRKYSSDNTNLNSNISTDSNTAPANITANRRNNNSAKPSVKMH